MAFRHGIRLLRPIAKRSFSSSLKFIKSHVELTNEEFASEAAEPILTNLRRRGLIEQITDENELEELIEKQKIKLYCGADPTAISLHLGNLLPLMILLHFNLRGHEVYGLVGGGTGVVGDPSGKTKARDTIDSDVRMRNVERIQSQLREILGQGVTIAHSRNKDLSIGRNGNQIIVNNRDWLQNLGLIDFLSRYGSFIRVSSMLARDSVKSRLESPAGLGFNEFTYQILQAFDFYHLFSNKGVTAQIGGNDQYGNITAGIDLISKITQKKAFGITVPLLTTSSGEKFGKSAGNAIFIDKQLTSPFQLYQFLINSADMDVPLFLRKFSFLPISIIDKIVDVHQQDKKQRIGQKVLAMEVCDLVHGDGVGYDNMIISDLIFNNENRNDKTPVEDIISAFEKQNSLSKISRQQLQTMNILELLLQLDNNATWSKSQLKRLITSGSVQIGLEMERPQQIEVGVGSSSLIGDKFLFIRVGKTKHFAVEIV